jgi:hypothetical protein
VPPGPAKKIRPASALAEDDDGLVLEGQRLITEETFGGNGRTCATCHAATNNFTIDPEFIRGLDHNDPLFVAEFDPALRNLERPRLMRSRGLILENLDGFENPGVMRGVPHTLGLRHTESNNEMATLTTRRSLRCRPASLDDCFTFHYALWGRAGFL